MGSNQVSGKLARESFAPFLVGTGSFFLALIVWCFNLGYRVSAIATAMGIMGFIGAEIAAHLSRQKANLKDLGVVLFMWWLFLSPWVIVVFGDITGLAHLYLQAARHWPLLKTLALSNVTLYVEICWIIPAALCHLWLIGKVNQNR